MERFCAINYARGPRAYLNLVSSVQDERNGFLHLKASSRPVGPLFILFKSSLKSRLCLSGNLLHLQIDETNRWRPLRVLMQIQISHCFVQFRNGLLSILFTFFAIRLNCNISFYIALFLVVYYTITYKLCPVMPVLYHRNVFFFVLFSKPYSHFTIIKYVWYNN